MGRTDTELPTYTLEYELKDQPDGSVMISGVVTQENVGNDWLMVLPVVFSFEGNQVARTSRARAGPEHAVRAEAAGEAEEGRARSGQLGAVGEDGDQSEVAARDTIGRWPPREMPCSRSSRRFGRGSTRSSPAGPTPAQHAGWPAIAGGASTLILAPTGSGKTLAAFLWCLNRLMFQPPPAKRQRCRVLYVSPLKALAIDVERNLRAPLVGIAQAAAAANVPVTMPTVGDSHGRHARRGAGPIPARAGRIS